MKETQRVKILNYLKEYGSITPLDALREFSCMRLATRIFELKADGYDIVTKIEKAKIPTMLCEHIVDICTEDK